MASIADAIAAGDLTADVQPQSSQDRLGIALRGMVGNLRSLVVGLEDRSAQAEQLVEELHAQIDDRKQVEGALSASEERNRLALLAAGMRT
jgi:methyl-accepting chemotaxis protein